MKRLVVVSDFHCGHRVGLTPPSWRCVQWKEDKYRHSFYQMQKQIWEFYKKTLKSLQPIDTLLVNGDCIDGKGERSGGTEIIEPEITGQVEMAIQCIELAKAKKVVMTHGTPYHVGVTSDFENAIASAVNAHIGGHEWLEIGGVVFDCKHSVSSSIIPHGRTTSIKREKLWNDLWSLEEGQEQPRADVLIRSHVHYHEYSGNPNYLAMTTPAMQGFGSKYGTRLCTGVVHVGLVHFDISKGGYSWQSHILRGEFLKAHPLKL